MIMQTINLNNNTLTINEKVCLLITKDVMTIIPYEKNTITNYIEAYGNNQMIRLIVLPKEEAYAARAKLYTMEHLMRQGMDYYQKSCNELIWYTANQIPRIHNNEEDFIDSSELLQPIKFLG